MTELRGPVPDLEKAKQHVAELGGVFDSTYGFTDTIYTRAGAPLAADHLRLRVYAEGGTGAVVSRREGKRKTELGRFGTAADAEGVIARYADGVYARSFSYGRRGWEYRLGNVRVYVEEIKGLGGSVEVEGEDEAILKITLKTLGVTETFADPLAVIMARRRGHADQPTEGPAARRRGRRG